MKTSIAKSPNVVLRKKESQLYLDINFQGKRKREYLKIKLTGRKEEDKQLIDLAKRIMSKRSYDLHSSQNNEFNREKQKANYIDFLEQIVIEQKKPNKKNSRWANTFKHIKDYAGAKVEFAQINIEWIEGFKKYLNKIVSQNSAATYYETFKSSLNRAVRLQYLSVNPALQSENIQRKKTVRTYLELEEIIKLDQTECKNTDIKRAFLFACFTGLRLSDVKALRWSNIRNNKITLTQVKTGDEIIIPVSKQAFKYLGAIQDNNNNLVFTLKDDEFTRRVIKKWSKESGIEKNISFHTSRHTFATLSLTYDVDIYTVSKLLGHSDVRITQIYAKLIDKKKEEAIDKLPTL